MFKWYKKLGAGTMEEWDKWERETKENYPIQYFFRETLSDVYMSLMMKIKTIKWWFLHRFYPPYRYHVIKPRSLKPGFYEPEDLILHSSFDILSEFVEEILMGDGVQRTTFSQEEYNELMTDEYAADMFKEQFKKTLKAIELRDWWVLERPNREELYPTVKDPEGEDNFMWFLKEKWKNTPEYFDFKKCMDKCEELDTYFHEEDQQKLRELIEIRPFLWS